MTNIYKIIENAKVGIVIATGALLLGTGIYEGARRLFSALEPQKVLVDGKTYTVTNNREGTLVREYPYGFGSPRIVDSDRNGKADAYKYTVVSGRVSIPVEVYPTDSQVDLFDTVTKKSKQSQ